MSNMKREDKTEVKETIVYVERPAKQGMRGISGRDSVGVVALIFLVLFGGIMVLNTKGIGK
jgi:hypothetical protein